MTFFIKPNDPCNRRPIKIQVSDQRASPLLVRLGDTVALGGIVRKVATPEPQSESAALQVIADGLVAMNLTA